MLQFCCYLWYSMTTASAGQLTFLAPALTASSPCLFRPRGKKTASRCFAWVPQHLCLVPLTPPMPRKRISSVNYLNISLKYDSRKPAVTPWGPKGYIHQWLPVGVRVEPKLLFTRPSTALLDLDPAFLSSPTGLFVSFSASGALPLSQFLKCLFPPLRLWMWLYAFLEILFSLSLFPCRVHSTYPQLKCGFLRKISINH